MMLGKLMKHEFRATGRINLVLCGIMLALAVAAGVLLPPWAQGENATFGFRDQVGATVLIFYGLSVFAVVIGVFIALLLRYKRNLLGDEGYLMRTLPVSIHELFLSKLFTALLWTIGAELVIALSVLVIALVAMISGAISSEEIRYLLDGIFRILAQLDAFTWIWGFIYHLSSAAFFFLLCYANMTMLQTFSKHKGLCSVVSIVVIIVVLRLVFAFNTWIFAPDASLPGNGMGEIADHVARSVSIGTIELLLADVGLYFLTWAFLKYKPNLE